MWGGEQAEIGGRDGDRGRRWRGVHGEEKVCTCLCICVRGTAKRNMRVHTHACQKIELQDGMQAESRIWALL